MTRTRASASFAAASAFVGAFVLSAAMGAPSAHADPLDAIRAAVNGNRNATKCGPYAYNGALEGIAQALVRNENPGDGGAPGYDGVTRSFQGHGDPQAQAINQAYLMGAGPQISDCDFTEFGVGFLRNDKQEVDWVEIVFGKPTPKPAEAPQQQQQSQSQQQAQVPVQPEKPTPVAPTDAVTLNFGRGAVQWTVNVASSADIAGKCTYAASNPVLPGVNKSFDLAPKGTASFSVLAPPVLSSFHVVVSCSGPFNGKTVEYGHVEQDVP